MCFWLGANPAEHSVQVAALFDVDPSGPFEVALHGIPSHFGASFLVEYIPGVHAVHVIPSLNCPGTQPVPFLMHLLGLVDPVVGVVVLGPQLVHLVFPCSSMYVATGHNWQSFCRPVSSENFPRPQSLQDGEVVSSA